VGGVAQAGPAAAGFRLLSRRRAPVRRRPAGNSAASSRRAAWTAPDGSIWPRMRAAAAAQICVPRPPGTSPQHRVQPAGAGGRQYWPDLFFGLLVFGAGLGSAFVAAQIAALTAAAQDASALPP